MPNAFKIYSYRGDLDIGSGNLLPSVKKLLKNTKWSHDSSVDIPEIGRSNASAVIGRSRWGVLTAFDDQFGMKDGKLAKKIPVYTLRWDSKGGDSFLVEFDSFGADIPGERQPVPFLTIKKKKANLGGRNFKQAERAWLTGSNRLGISLSSLKANLYEGDDNVSVGVTQSALLNTGTGNDKVAIGFTEYGRGEKIEVFLGDGDDRGVVNTRRGGSNISVSGGRGNDVLSATTGPVGGGNQSDPLVSAKIILSGGSGADSFYGGDFTETWITDYEQGVDEIIDYQPDWYVKKGELTTDPLGNTALRVSFGGIAPGYQVGFSAEKQSALTASSMLISGVTSLDQLTFTAYSADAHGSLFQVY